MKINTRLIITIGIVIAIGIVGYIVYVSWQSRDKTATIDIQSIVPDDINITINGEKAASNGKIAVIPGTYTVAAKRSGFADKSQTVEAKAHETTTVRLLLDPINEEGYTWARNHPDAFREYEALQGKLFDETGARMTTKYPLVSHLPETRTRWRVDYGQSVQHPNDPNAIAITITYGGFDEDKQNAIDWIKSLGFNPADYEIIYQTPATDVGD